jgi:Winged helix-turn-helix DNA-binding
MSLSGSALARPTRATLIGLLIGTGLAIVAAMGPLVSAITITVGVETQVGDASGLPDARMLPAALEGVGAVALIFLLTRRPMGRLRAWSAALILVSLGAGMAAQGAHAVWFDERTHHLALPWNVRLLVSFVPPVSGLATLHLIVKMAEDLLGTVRLLVTATPESEAEVAEAPPSPALASPGIDYRVLRLVRSNSRTTWRVVSERTGLSEANAKRALTAARKRLRDDAEVPASQEVLDPMPVHPNGGSG